MHITVSVADREWGGKQSWMLHAALSLRNAGHDVLVAAEPDSALATRAHRAGLVVVELALDEDAPVPAIAVTGADLVLMTGRHDARAITRQLEATDASAVRVLMRHSPFALEDDAATRAMLGKVAAVILTSEEQREGFSEVASDRLHVMRSAVDTRRFTSCLPDPALLAALKLTPGTPVVGCFGRLSWEKGHAVLLRALAGLPDVVALIAGEGPEAGSLAALADQLGVAARVRFLGLRDDVDELLCACTAVVLPSLAGETGPLALKEAMAAGRPVVSTRVGGIPAIVDNGRTGLLVGPGDPGSLAAAVRRLLDAPNFASELGAAARRAIEADHRAAQRDPAFVALLEALHIEHGSLERYLAGRRWVRPVRVRREDFGALLFVPASSFVTQLPEEAAAVVERSVRADDVDALVTLTASASGRELLMDLHRSGALTAAPRANG